MFPYNQQPTTTSHELGKQPESFSCRGWALLTESMNLTERHFAEAAMVSRRGARRTQEARAALSLDTRSR